MRVTIVLVSFLICVIKPVTVAASHAFTVESYSASGKACYTDCVEGFCYVSYKTKESCTPGTRPAPIYFSTGYRNSSYTKCLSKCLFDGYDYAWCYVTEDVWDYCSPYTGADRALYQYTTSKETCKDECSKHSESYLWCITYSGKWDYCKESQFFGESAMTVEGQECSGDCYRHDGDNYYWCYVNKIKKKCAPTAIRQECPASLLRGSPRRRRASGAGNSRPPSSISAYRDFVENNEDLETVTLSTPSNPDMNNPVLDYTYQTLASGLRIPYRIRSRILPLPWQHARVANSRTSAAISSDARTNCQNMGMNCESALAGNNDHCGHLVPYILGGPSEWYNIVPQSRRINTGTTANTDVIHSASVWRSMERFMRHWVRNERGFIEHEVLVTYNDVTRPTGFGAYYKFYKADGTLVHDCNGYWFSNDPNQDPDDWNR